MSVAHITDQEFQDKVLKSEKPVIVDFYAVWCGPCKLAEPVLEELSELHKEKLTILKIDVDQSPQAAQNHGVMSIPTTILFKNGQEVARQVGFAGRKPFEDLISKA